MCHVSKSDSPSVKVCDVEKYGDQTYDGLKTVRQNNMRQVDAVWNEIQL